MFLLLSVLNLWLGKRFQTSFLVLYILVLKDHFFIISTDTSIYGPLFEHVEAAGDRPVILINPDLSDKVSAAGQQSVRGRSERIAFQNSFETIYHFQCTYVSGTSYFPILGALGRFGADQPWVAYQRRDRVNNGGEVYIPVICDEQRPDGEAIMKSMDM